MPGRNTRVTIVTVVYNSAKLLEKTIQSVIVQTYQDMEYIIIDGGSTDGTLEIINKYRENISCFISEPDKGIYDAMNKGVKYAAGEWIAFLNAGDVYYSPETIEEMMDRAVSDCGIIYGDTINSDGKYEKARKLYMMNFAMCFCHQSCLVRKEYLLIRPFNISYKICADYDFFLWCRQSKKVFLYISKPISVFDINGYAAQHIAELVAEKEEIIKSELRSRILIYHLYKCARAVRLLVVDSRNRKANILTYLRYIKIKLKELKKKS